MAYTRKCPQCGDIIEYKSKYNRKYADERSSICKECNGKKTSERMKIDNPAKRPEVRKKLRENHADISGDKNPFHRIRFYGDKNPSKRIDVRRKISQKKKGIKNPKLCGKNNGNWRHGKSQDKYGYEFDKKLRTEVRQRDKFVCAECSKNGYVVHHIDYNKMNNKRINLITLCSSCHGKTNWNRKEWQLKFEKIVIEREKTFFNFLEQKIFSGVK